MLTRGVKSCWRWWRSCSDGGTTKTNSLSLKSVAYPAKGTFGLKERAGRRLLFRRATTTRAKAGHKSRLIRNLGEWEPFLGEALRREPKGGIHFRSEMSRLMEAVRAITASGGRGTRNTGRYCPKVVESCPAAANIIRGSRFSIPRPLTRPGADSWFVRACRRPAALLHDRPSDRSLDGVLESSVSWWAKWYYWGQMGSDRSLLRPSQKLARAFARFPGVRSSQD